MLRKQPFRFLLGAALAGGAFALGACGDTPTSAGSKAPSAERAAVETRTSQVARNLALALRDAAVRASLHGAMKESPVQEGKLGLASYLRSQGGATLLREMARAARQTPEALLRELDALPSLEFYLPVARHRAEWAGGSNITVAAQLADDASLSGFDLAGNAIALSSTTPPATPVLVVTGRERWRPALAAAGPLRRDETCHPEAFRTCGGETSGPVTLPKGLYMYDLALTDLGEPWSRGAPEIEVMTRSSDYGDMAAVSCAAEGASGYRGFNMDTHTWDGAVLLLDSSQVAAGIGYAKAIDVWEDDTVECETYTDVNMDAFYRESRDAGIALGVIILDVNQDPSRCNDTELGQTICAVALLAQFAQMAWSGVQNLIGSNDDFLGAVAHPSRPSSGAQTLEIRRGSNGQSVNGSMTVRWVRY